MTDERAAEFQVITWIGMCLLCVQGAEHRLSRVIELVLDRPKFDITRQSVAERKQTLGDLLMRLKNTVKLDYNLKERLFRFLEMRNKFVHNLSDVPGWNLGTEDGRVEAKIFLAELSFTALAITALTITIFSISAKEDFGKDLFEEDSEETRQRVAILEELFGEQARKVLEGRGLNSPARKI